MVIPLGGGPDDGSGGAMGGMMQPMVGPPPDELVSRFKKIKVCLIAMIVAIVMQLGAGIPLQPSASFQIILNTLNGVFIIVVGIFLLKDDPMFQGGMACLCSWFFICLVTAVLALIPTDGSQINSIIYGFQTIANEQANVNIKWGFSVGSYIWYALFATFVASEVLLLLAQIFGGWHGYKAMKEWQQAVGENSPAPAATAPPQYGGGRVGGGGFGGGGDAMGGNSAAPSRAATAPPVLFSGQGQRLGS